MNAKNEKETKMVWSLGVTGIPCGGFGQRMESAKRTTTLGDRIQKL